VCESEREGGGGGGRVACFLASKCGESGLTLTLLHAAVKSFDVQTLGLRKVLEQGGVQVHTGTRQHECDHLLILVLLQTPSFWEMQAKFYAANFMQQILGEQTYMYILKTPMKVPATAGVFFQSLKEKVSNHIIERCNLR
jgi:hypothetical protein